MNSQTGVNEMLALLDALKAAVRDFAAREEKLESRFRVQSAAVSDALASQNEAQAIAADENETAAEAALEEGKNLLQSRFEKRRLRISRAHAAVNQWVQDAIARCDAEWKDRTKEGVSAAELRRADELAAATTAYNNFQQGLAAAGNELAKLEAAARGAFRGYGKFRRLLAPEKKWPEPDLSPDENALFGEFQKLQAKVSGDVGRFRKLPLPLLFKFLPVWLLAAVCLGGVAANPVLAYFHRNDVTQLEAGIALAAFFLVIVIYFIGGHLSAPLAKTIAGDLARMRRLFDVCSEKSVAHLKSESARIEKEFETAKNNFNHEWRQAVREISDSRSTNSKVISEKAARIVQKNDRWHRTQLERIQPRHAEVMARLRAEDSAQARQIAEAYKTKTAQLEGEHQQRWRELETDWENSITPLCDQLRAANEAAGKVFPAWNDAVWKDWKPPTEFQNAAKFARLESSVEKFAGPLPKDPRLKWPSPQNISAPLSLLFPAQGSILFESGKTAGDDALGAINSIIFRLLATTPPGKLSFTIFDPVGLGQNFSSLMHLADYEEGSINSRIWTQSAQFEEKLAELNEHMEKIIQMYLRNEYATITEYNAQAGSVAEKYHFLVIASFPVNFSDTAAKRLRNIAANGARCGVFTLIHWDQRNAVPQDFVPDELRKNSVCLVRTDSGFELSNWRSSGIRLLLDSPPPPEFAKEFLIRVGEGSKNASRVEVPFEQIAPTELWQEETTEILRVPIGRSGATKFQYLEIGSGTRQHALIAGKTGSGKSTLFHVIITNLALRCSPDEVEFYLIDFKKGVEFKCYGSRKLPHARVVAIESDREFGLSVLQRLDEELRRRGDLFRKVGAQDLAGYKRAGGIEPVPRSLLMIDEFQEFFTEEDRISQGAAVLLDRIVRQGRAFGIHVLLGSQTLGGAYTLARATIGQMVIRIALQCNEADAYLIMDQDNPAPRLLSRPGEGIYNDAAGAIEGNSPFQAVWLSDKTRDSYLAKIRERADQKANQYPGPLVFEGNAPADVRENLILRNCLQVGLTCWKKLRRKFPCSPASGSARPIPSKARPRRFSGGRAAAACSSSARARNARRRSWQCRSSHSRRNFPRTPRGLCCSTARRRDFRSGNFWSASSAPCRMRRFKEATAILPK